MSNWNGKIKCIENDGDFTEGQTYDVRNGVIISDSEVQLGRFSDLTTLNKCLNSQFEEVNEVKIPALCELLDVEVNEKFKIKDNRGNIINSIYFINSDGYLYSQPDKLAGRVNTVAMALINKEMEIIKLPQYQFSENEITILSGLYLNDYKYITRDEDGDLWGYKNYPKQLEHTYDYNNDDDDCLADIKDEFFQQVQWGNILDIEYQLSQIN